MPKEDGTVIPAWGSTATLPGLCCSGRRDTAAAMASATVRKWASPIASASAAVNPAETRTIESAVSSGQSSPRSRPQPGRNPSGVQPVDECTGSRPIKPGKLGSPGSPSSAWVAQINVPPSAVTRSPHHNPLQLCHKSLLVGRTVCHHHRIAPLTAAPYTGWAQAHALTVGPQPGDRPRSSAALPWGVISN